MEKIGIQLSNYGLTVEPWNYGCRPTDESASLIAGIIANKMNQCENLSPTDFEQIGDVANGSEDPIKKNNCCPWKLLENILDDSPLN